MGIFLHLILLSPTTSFLRESGNVWAFLLFRCHPSTLLFAGILAKWQLQLISSFSQASILAYLPSICLASKLRQISDIFMQISGENALKAYGSSPSRNANEWTMMHWQYFWFSASKSVTDWKASHSSSYYQESSTCRSCSVRRQKSQKTLSEWPAKCSMQDLNTGILNGAI